VLRIFGRLNQKTEAVQTGNGSGFQTAFHWHLADRGIRHIYIKPAAPS
jgi:hypothetical protein